MNNKDQQQSEITPPNLAFTESNIKLPKGGGAICGVIENFDFKQVAGTYSKYVSLATNPATIKLPGKNYTHLVTKNKILVEVKKTCRQTRLETYWVSTVQFDGG